MYALLMRLSCLLALVIAPSATATVYYQYQGDSFNNFQNETPPAGSYDPTDRVAGWVGLSAAIPPSCSNCSFTAQVVSFEFSDGRFTIDAQSSSGFDFDAVSTDASGNLVSWRFAARLGAFGGGFGSQFVEVTTERVQAFSALDSGFVSECVNPSGCAPPCPGCDQSDAGGRSSFFTQFPEPNRGASLLAGVVALAGLAARRRQRARKLPTTSRGGWVERGDVRWVRAAGSTATPRFPSR
jgi:hypothetical protein